MQWAGHWSKNPDALQQVHTSLTEKMWERRCEICHQRGHSKGQCWYNSQLYQEARGNPQTQKWYDIFRQNISYVNKKAKNDAKMRRKDAVNQAMAKIMASDSDDD